MKNMLSCLNEEIAWNEFEVIAHNCNHAVHFVNRALRNRMKKFQVHPRHHRRVCLLDTEQVLDYTYFDEDMTLMEEFRVQRHNEMFGFSADNPSDSIFQEHSSN